jgi:hypothetical protein
MSDLEMGVGRVGGTRSNAMRCNQSAGSAPAWIKSGRETRDSSIAAFLYSAGTIMYQ